MPEQIQAPMRDETDIKIFILYLMEHIGRPLDFIEVNDIVVQDGVVKPFDFCLAFPDLIESGHVLRTEKDGKETFTVTDLGRNVLENLENKILLSTRDRALQSAVRLLNMQKSNTGYRYQTEAFPNGSFGFHIVYSEQGKDVLTVTASVSTKREAENMESEFEQHPELFRRALIALLSNNAASLIAYDPFRLL